MENFIWHVKAWSDFLIKRFWWAFIFGLILGVVLCKEVMK